MNKFIADSDALKRRIRYLKTPVYLLLALWLFLIYYKPELINNSTILGLISGVVVFMFFDALLRHYQHALDLHGTEQLIFSQSGFEFIQKSTGYSFVKKNEDIVSVDYRRFLGARESESTLKTMNCMTLSGFCIQSFYTGNCKKDKATAPIALLLCVKVKGV